MSQVLDSHIKCRSIDESRMSKPNVRRDNLIPATKCNESHCHRPTLYSHATVHEVSARSQYGLLYDRDVSKDSLIRESPEYVRTSFAAAVTLGLAQGRFFRDAKLYCINLLLTYSDGCAGRCAYCGLSRARQTSQRWTEQSFIRVDWPTFRTDEIIQRTDSQFCSHVQRVCLSMVTHKRAAQDTLNIVRRLHEKIDSISVLTAPTIVDGSWLVEAREAGVDKVGVAIDAATPELFDDLRGRGVSGPHEWERYWRIVEEAVEIFGRHNVGIHLIVGLGEKEQEMIETIQRAYSIGAMTHLFSFFPEQGSLMHQHRQPQIGSYRRAQLARYLINKRMTSADEMTFNEEGKLVAFGVDKNALDDAISSGRPFMTSGCSTKEMENACNRPFSDSTPYQAYTGNLRNFPFRLDEKDISIVRRQLWDYSDTQPRAWVGDLNCEDCTSAV